MTCMICKVGSTRDGKVTVTLQREESIIIIKNVPAKICQNCGEYYLNEEVTDNVLKRAEKAVENRPEVEILQYAS